jgi:hypothetical protein
MILPTNLDINKKLEKHLNDTTSNVVIGVGLSGQSSSSSSKESTNAEFNIEIDVLDKSAIKKETYYKMKYIMNSLDKNWAIKKRENIFYLKNLDNSTKDIITEDYLNKRVIQKIYNEAMLRTASGDDINKEIKKQATSTPTSTPTPTPTPTPTSTQPSNVPIMRPRKKEDIISLKDGILALKELMNKETMNNEY